MDTATREFKGVPAGTRLKLLPKSSCRVVIRTLSWVPDVILFRGAILFRKFGLALKRASAPIALQRAADFLFYSLRYMHPGLVEARLRGRNVLCPINDTSQYDLLLRVHEAEMIIWYFIGNCSACSLALTFALNSLVVAPQ
jgi:hypothetical protein